MDNPGEMETRTVCLNGAVTGARPFRSAGVASSSRPNGRAMDDSPMYDDVTYNPKTYTMELDDVGLNSLYALDAECLAKIAAILGYEDDNRRFVAEYDRVKSLVRRLLWNEQEGIFENRY